MIGTLRIPARAAAALIVAALIVGGLVLADRLMGRIVDFRIMADTEVFAAELRSLGAADMTIGLDRVQICHGVNLASPAASKGPCGGYAQSLAAASGELRVVDGVRARLVRRGSEAAILRLTALGGAPTPACPEGVIGFLDAQQAAGPGIALCSPALVRWPAGPASGEAPRLVLRGVNPRIGDSAGAPAGDAVPLLWAGKIEMRARGLISDLLQHLRGADLEPLADAVPMGSRDLGFAETVSACTSEALCAGRARGQAPFIALISAQSAGGLKANVHVLSSAAVVEDFGARAELLSPTLFARVRNDPNVAILYVLLGVLAGLVLRVDGLLFGRKDEQIT